MSELPPLRSYQEDAINAALENECLLLAMTMGSGKTRTAIEIVENLASFGTIQGGAVFVLNSTKYQWQREIKHWSGQTALVIDGTKKQREAQYKKSRYYRYTILNYEALVHDWELIQEFLPIDFIVADEVTSIKNFTPKKSKRLKILGKHTDYRFGMSGQPVENRPEELFSIMEFVDPSVLGPFGKFDRTFIQRDHFGRPKKYMNLPQLHARLGPVMFRRSREDIADAMPKVLNLDTPIPLDPSSRVLYDYIKEDLLGAIDLAVAAGMGGFNLLAHYGRAEGDGDAIKGSIMARVSAMRSLCDHPQLLRRSADRFNDELTPGGSAYIAELDSLGMLDKLPTKSPKLEALFDTIDSILSEDPANKVVVFSGFTSMLDLISEGLTGRKITHTVLSGAVASKERDERIVRFNSDPGCRVFLSSDAGAYGVNLDAGSHLISYDLPWSAGAYAQRISRIDRLSSVHDNIVIDNMFCKDTVEEWQHGMLQQKNAVGGAFIDQKYDESGGLSLDLASLKQFLETS